jgi:hypothetical protein
MTDIAVAYLNGELLADLEENKRQVIRKSVDVLTFGAVTEQLRTAIGSDFGGFGVSNSERFQLITQGLGNLEDYVNVVSGGMQQVSGIDDVHFCIPWCAGSDFYRLDDDFVVPLSALVHDASSLGERLGRALEWFRLAHTGNDETSEFSRVVMMATAYEILLDPDDQKREGICTAINDLTAQREVRTERVTIGRKVFDLSAPAVWFDHFYRLRNQIVHGDQVELDQLRYAGVSPRLTHRMVAALVLWELVAWYLFARGDVAEGSYKLAKSFSQVTGKDEPEPEFVRYVASNSLGITDMHKALGWYEETD